MEHHEGLPHHCHRTDGSIRILVDTITASDSTTDGFETAVHGVESGSKYQYIQLVQLAVCCSYTILLDAVDWGLLQINGVYVVLVKFGVISIITKRATRVSFSWGQHCRLVGVSHDLRDLFNQELAHLLIGILTGENIAEGSE